jgi:predicted hotdog family 3-hydroxylacyl-ACP dehydratase
MTVFAASSNTVIENQDLLNILPHKGKMLLISRIMSYNVTERTLRSEYDIGKNCLFYDPALAGVPAWMSFEFMAQAVSALSGLTGKVMGKPPMIGFILSVSALSIKIPVLGPGVILGVDVIEELKVGPVSTFRCTAFDGEHEAAHAKLMVMDIEDPSEFLEKNNYGN